MPLLSLARLARLKYGQRMNTVDLAMQRVAGLDEALASKLLDWLDGQQAIRSAPSKEPPLGAQAMIGFALRGGRPPRATAEWMRELREGDED